MTRQEEIEQAAQRLAETKRTEQAKQQCLYDFEVAAHWADEHPHWINAEERLPAEGQEVLVWAVTRNLTSINFRAIFYSWRKTAHQLPFDKVDENDFMLYSLGSRHDYSGFHVTHWMPIPHPPVTKGGAS